MGRNRNMVLELEQTAEVPSGFLSLMQRAADAAVQAEGVHVKTAVHILLCNDEEIRTYNREWRQIDRATDVLSFPLVSENGRCMSQTSDAGL